MLDGVALTKKLFVKSFMEVHESFIVYILYRCDNAYRVASGSPVAAFDSLKSNSCEALLKGTSGNLLTTANHVGGIGFRFGHGP